MGWCTQVRYARMCCAVVDVVAHASVTIFYFFRFGLKQANTRREKKRSDGIDAGEKKKKNQIRREKSFTEGSIVTL